MISEHEARFFQALLRHRAEWLTSKKLAAEANIAYRTSRYFSKKFADLGLVEVRAIFPGLRYRLRPDASGEYMDRLQEAVRIIR